METLIQDIRYALRTLRKAPGFTAIAVVSLALGIGANTAIFSLIDALMLRQLPVREPERLALAGSGRAMGISGGIAGQPMDLVSEPQLEAIRKDGRFFEDAAGLFSLPWTYHGFVAGAAKNEPVKAHVVTGNYFSVLGVKPACGRLFTGAQDKPLNAHPDMVISNAWWKQRFGGAASAVGQHIRIADRLYTIIGVTPPEFFGTIVGESPDAWLPLSMQSALPPFFDFHEGKMDQSLYLIGRLKPGISMQQASAGLTGLMRQLLRSYAGASPSARDLGDIAKTSVALTPAAKGLSSLRRSFSTALQVLMIVVALVLIIACANVANLLLARATAREREIAVRFAVGSGRARVLRQLLTESILLALAGGALGVVFAMWGTQILLFMVASGPDPIPLDVDPNLRVLGFTFAVSLLTGLLFGVAPAFRASLVNLNFGLREGRSGTASRSRMFAGRALVVSQVAVSLLLLTGAGLFLRSFRNLERIDAGFNRERVLLFAMDTDSAGYQQDARLAAVYRKIENRVGEIPGVEAASFSLFVFNQGEMSLRVAVEGHPEMLANGRSMSVQITGPDYLKAAGIPILRGRYLASADSAKSPKVAVINAQAAKDLFGAASPVGKHMSIGKPEHGLDIEIVGVVKNAKYGGLREDTPWVVYVPYDQRVQFLGNLLVKAKGNPLSITAQVRKAIEETDRNIPITEVTTMGAMVDRSLQTEHLIAQLSSFFGALALFLATFGLYGILSYSVARRTSEIGVRMALGAQSGGVLWMVLRETLQLMAVGVLAGVPLAMLGARFIESMLYGVKAGDALALVSAAGVLGIAGACAGLVPARRASRVDPMAALRYE